MKIHGFLTCLLAGLLLTSCGSAADLKACRQVADEFMISLARRDFNGAYAQCDPLALDQDVLFKIGNNPDYDDLLNDYKGLKHGDGGQLLDGATHPEVRLAPAVPNGHASYRIHFAFRKLESGWKVIGFQITKAE